MLNFDNPKITCSIILIIIMCVILLVSVTSHIINEKYTELVQNTSPRLQKIEYLYKKYDFSLFNCEQVYPIYVKSKASFDRFNFDMYFEKIIENNYQEMAYSIKKARSNVKKWKDMKTEYDTLPDLVQRGDEVIKHHSYLLYHKIESQLVPDAEHKLLQVPLDVYFVCVVKYTSPQGRNSYSKRKIYSEPEMLEHYSNLLERKKRQTSTNIERRKMSPTLRYNVMMRDGFRCVLCGRNPENDGVKLEVDHIIPVSKGEPVKKFL